MLRHFFGGTNHASTEHIAAGYNHPPTIIGLRIGAVLLPSANDSGAWTRSHLSRCERILFLACLRLSNPNE